MALAFAVSASAQGRWQAPYDAGRRAFEKQLFQEAVDQLERAIKIDARQEPNKRIEGVYTADYFPYYYLGLAYLELRNYPKAKENLDKAGDRLARNLVPALEQGRQRLALAMNPPPTTPTVNPRYAQLVRDADAALGARRYREALTAFDAARAADAGEYGRQSVQTRRDQAARSLAMELTEEGRGLMTKSPSQARTRLEEALKVSPGLKEAADALASIRAADEAYATAKNGAEQDIMAGNFQAALPKLQDAQRSNPERYSADNLGVQMTLVVERLAAPPPGPGRGGRRGGGAGPVTPPPTPPADLTRMFDDAVLMSKNGQYAEAEAGYAAVVKLDPAHKQAAAALENSRRFKSLVDGGRLEEAQKLDGLRFRREGLVVVPPGSPIGVDAARESLRQGLEALLSGDAQRSIAIFEPAVRRGPAANASSTAALHAYLGVAYATRMLSSASSDEQTKLQADAIGQFRQAVAADRTYALSPRIVSPKILTLFEEAKR